MAQYDPIVVKAGVPTALGVDAARVDLAAVAGLTTSGLAAGDACQVSAALTLGKAVNTSTAPVVGIYDGTSGSVVREGVVVATMKAGVVLANGDAVYLSSTVGALTNVKPTADTLHEVGVVVDAAARKVQLHPNKPVVVLPPSPPLTIWGAGWANNLEVKLAATGAHVASYTLFSVGQSCKWVVFDGTRVWSIYNTDPGQLAGVNVLTGALTGPFTVGKYSGLTFDGTYLWLCDYFGSPYYARKVDLAGNVVGSYASGAAYPSCLCYDGVDSVWIGNGSDNNVRRMRCLDGTITATVATGGTDTAGMCSTKTHLWVGCTSGVRKIRISDNAAIGTYPNGGTWGGTPCYDGTRIWQAVGGDYLRCWNEADGAFIRDVDTGNYHGASAQVPCFDGTHIWVNHQYSLGTDYGWHKFLASDGSYVGTYNGAQTSQKAQLCSTASVLPSMP